MIRTTKFNKSLQWITLKLQIHSFHMRNLKNSSTNIIFSQIGIGLQLTNFFWIFQLALENSDYFRIKADINALNSSKQSILSKIRNSPKLWRMFWACSPITIQYSQKQTTSHRLFSHLCVCLVMMSFFVSKFFIDSLQIGWVSYSLSFQLRTANISKICIKSTKKKSLI